jgi:hypothetical protein
MKKTMEFTRSLAGLVYYDARVTWNRSRGRSEVAVVALPLTTRPIPTFLKTLAFRSSNSD